MADFPMALNGRDAFLKREEQYKSCFEKHLDNGVVFHSRDGILIDDEVEIASGAVILPGTVLMGKTKIGTGSVIGPNSMLTDSIIGENVVFNSSQGNKCSVDNGAQIGPFSQLRPDSHIGKNVHIGDFVEIKNSTIGEGTGVSHLTYIGDSDVGKYCNFGCGVAVANYDGTNKNRCTVGDYAFIGCNTNLVSPVNVGEGAYTAAGSTIVKDVPASALGIARAQQKNIENWADKKLSAYIEKKKKLENK